MNRIKVLISIVKEGIENEITNELDKYKIPFQLYINSRGSASASLLEYFGITETKRSLVMSIISEELEVPVLYDLNEQIKMNDPGSGIAFTIPISSSTKYLNEQFENPKKGSVKKMKNEKKYHLIYTIVQDGYFEEVINAAKKVGAKGGTLIKGRGLGYKDAVKFLGFQLEPERDIVLIVVEEELKNKLMETIVKKVGITTPGKGICFSLPIDNAIGLDGMVEFE